MADVQTTTLYEQDFYLWALGQARAVRALRDDSALPGPLRQMLDWDNLVEELEGSARGVRSELRRRLSTIIEHLVKLELSSAIDAKRGWRETIQRSRHEIELLLDENPSLRRETPEILQSSASDKSAKWAVEDLVELGEVRAGTSPPTYTQSQLLDHWWPGQEETKP